jgi:hypothetical protein
MKPKDYIYFFLIVLLASCSVQKRHYRQGFYVANKGKEQITDKNAKDSSIAHLDSSMVRDISLNKNSKYKHDCDTLILNDGNTILCKIDEVTKRSVRFKECTDSNQASNSIDAELVSKIKFYNGREKAISDNIASKTKENKKLIKGALVGKGLALAILAVLCEVVLLLVLFHVITIAVYLAIIFAVLNLLAAIIALVFGFNSLREIRKNPEVFKGKKTATLEIILGLLSLVSWLIILVAITV